MSVPFFIVMVPSSVLVWAGISVIFSLSSFDKISPFWLQANVLSFQMMVFGDCWNLVFFFFCLPLCVFFVGFHAPFPRHVSFLSYLSFSPISFCWHIPLYWKHQESFSILSITPPAHFFSWMSSFNFLSWRNLGSFSPTPSPVLPLHPGTFLPAFCESPPFSCPDLGFQFSLFDKVLFNSQCCSPKGTRLLLPTIIFPAETVSKRSPTDRTGRKCSSYTLLCSPPIPEVWSFPLLFFPPNFVFLSFVFLWNNLSGCSLCKEGYYLSVNPASFLKKFF